MIFRSSLVLILIVFWTNLSFSQEIIGLSTTYDDSFIQWEVICADESNNGRIEPIWTGPKAWTEFRYFIGDESGLIKQQWHGDNNFWEIRANGQTITIQTEWSDEWNKWIVRSGTNEWQCEAKYLRIREEWIVSKSRKDQYYFYTQYEGDKRDWVVEPLATSTLSVAEQMAVYFIPILHAVPRR